ncbi:hypothetical protein F7734_33665 [Scytonema sp. UIC 10036]|uniref:WbqC family protein n=1 Tax=Scytonema sp. UIC 10036 TaxID=2304196 RepID=UPI0012DAC1CE|nr:WbqC family protein [Scytonema sp. UIC 10036]MUG97021.1 hypothetical protein [Scytonema sp. UIC 10036]
MKCAIMQPTYMPWAGYFNLISQADIFVFLDDVQYEKSSWQNRNRILLNGQVHWITVPSQRLYLGQSIKNIQIDEKRNWRQKHFKLISQAYAKHPYINELLNVLEIILEPSIIFLSELNIKIIRAFANSLNLYPKFVVSSELNICGQRTERLVKICEYFNCNEYVSPVGATEYLSKDGDFKDSQIHLSFQEFLPSNYAQHKQNSFISHLSILDVLANLGWKKTSQYVTTGTVN